MQAYVTTLLLRTGFLPRLPLMRMMLRTLQFVGADPVEVKRAFSRATDLGPSFVQAWRSVGNEVATSAQQTEGRFDRERARAGYFRAALYHLIADWGSERQRSTSNSSRSSRPRRTAAGTLRSFWGRAPALQSA